MSGPSFTAGRSSGRRKEGRPYLYRNRKPGTPPPATRPTTHDTSVLGLGLSAGGEAIFFSYEELGRSRLPGEISLGDLPVRVHYEAEDLTAWAEGADGELLPGVMVYRDSWMEFNEGSREFRAGVK